jgi:hypothetical protein
MLAALIPPLLSLAFAAPPPITISIDDHASRCSSFRLVVNGKSRTSEASRVVIQEIDSAQVEVAAYCLSGSHSTFLGKQVHPATADAIITFAVPTLGSISGRVVDLDGKALRALPLQLSWFQVDRFGIRRTVVRRVSTDDNGGFILPNLWVGSYYLKAVVEPVLTEQGIKQNIVESQMPVGNLPTFYPNSRFIDSAMPIRVSDTSPNVEELRLVVQRGPQHCVTFQTDPASAKSPKDLPLALLFSADDDTEEDVALAVEKPWGKRFCGFASGRYKIFAPAIKLSAKIGVAKIALTNRRENIAEVPLSACAPVEVSIQLPGDFPANDLELSKLGVSFAPHSRSVYFSGEDAKGALQPLGDSLLQKHCIFPGVYNFRLNGLPDRLYAASVSMDSLVSNGTVSISAGVPNRMLVVLKDGAGTLKLRPNVDAPVTEPIHVCYRYDDDSSGLCLTWLPGQQSFNFRNLRPGTYSVLQLGRLDEMVSQKQLWLRHFNGTSISEVKRFTMHPGETKTLAIGHH